MSSKEWGFAIKCERMARQNKVSLKFDKSTNWRDDDRIDVCFVVLTAKRKLCVWRAKPRRCKRDQEARKCVGFNDCNQTADIFKFIYTYFVFILLVLSLTETHLLLALAHSLARALTKWKIFYYDSLTVFFLSLSSELDSTISCSNPVHFHLLMLWIFPNGRLSRQSLHLKCSFSIFLTPSLSVIGLLCFLRAAADASAGLNSNF